MKRINSQEGYRTHIQPAFLIGTYNEDGTPNFCPITWVTSTWDDDHSLMVISMNGAKKTKENIKRTNLLSANLVSTDMIELLDYFGSCSALEKPKTAVKYEFEDGNVLKVPTLNKSRRVFECEVVNTFETSDTTTYFCRSRNCQQIEGIEDGKDCIEKFDPIVYTGRYFKLGEFLGEPGDFT